MTVNILYQTINLLLLVSAGLLLDALRRINKVLKKNPFLELNAKIMYMHIIMLVVHVSVFVTAAFLVFRSFREPDNTTYQI